MPRISLEDVYSVGDLISTEDFELIFGNIPNISGSTKSLTIKCLNATYPGFSNEIMTANIAGFVRNQRGRKMYPRKLIANFVEDSKMGTLNVLRNWSEYIVGSNSGVSSGSSNDYSVDAILNVYNQQATLIDTITFHKCFLEDVADVPLSGEGTTLAQVQLTCSYDWAESTLATTL